MTSRQSRGHSGVEATAASGQPVLLSLSSLTQPGTSSSADTGQQQSVVINQVRTHRGMPGFEDPDKPLSTFDKINLAVMVVFLYGMFTVAVVLSAVYSKQ